MQGESVRACLLKGDTTITGESEGLAEYPRYKVACPETRLDQYQHSQSKNQFLQLRWVVIITRPKFRLPGRKMLSKLEKFSKVFLCEMLRNYNILAASVTNSWATSFG